MQIDRVIYPIRTLGPGNRLVIWTIGCSKKCPSCANRELWIKDDYRELPVDIFFERLTHSINDIQADGITITGGDPLEQKGDILRLLPMLKTINNDILLYTGYTLDELYSVYDKDEMNILKTNISVLIDGRYIDSMNNNDCPLRGSTNQNIIYFDESMKTKYEKYMENGREIQNVYYKDRMISVGIHNKGY